MVTLIDTNVIINYITQREDDQAEASQKVINLCAHGRIDGYLAFHSLSIIWYVFRKRPVEETRSWLKQICTILSVCGASHNAVMQAIDNYAFKDFEDCLQDKCAVSIGADYIVTVNTKDYAVSEIPAVTPAELLSMLEK